MRTKQPTQSSRKGRRRPLTLLTRHVTPSKLLISCNDASDHHFVRQSSPLSFTKVFWGGRGSRGHDGPTRPNGGNRADPRRHVPGENRRRRGTSPSGPPTAGRDGLIDPLVLGAIPGVHSCERGRPESRRREPSRDRSTSESSTVRSSKRRRGGALMARPPWRLSAPGPSETLCPMFLKVVKNDEDPAGLPSPQARTTRPDPADTPRVAFRVSTTSGEWATIQAQS